MRECCGARLYDNNGNRLTAVNNTYTETFTYDSLNRMATSVNPFGLTLTFGYDAASNRLRHRIRWVVW